MARGGSPLGRLALGTLALLVVALAASAVYGRFGPRLRRWMGVAPARVVRVQVLNGCGEGGVAARLATYLRDGGFQVVEVANADRQDYFATLVVARRQDPSSAEAVARYLGGPPVIRQAAPSGPADVTVVIGGDRSRLRIGP